MSFFAKRKKESVTTPAAAAPAPATAPAPVAAPTAPPPVVAGAPPMNQSPPMNAPSQIPGPGFPRPVGSQAPMMGAGGSGSGSGIPVLSGSQPPSSGPPNGMIPPQQAGPGPNGVAPASQSQGGQVQGQGLPARDPREMVYPWGMKRLQILPPLAPFSNADGSQAPVPPSSPSPHPFPRYGHSVNYLARPGSNNGAGDLFIFGGLVRDEVKNDLYVVTYVTPPPQVTPPGGPAASAQNQIVQVAMLETKGEVPGPRVGHASVGVKNVLIVWGGDTKTKQDDPQDDGLYLLNTGTREWSKVVVTGKRPEGRYGHCAGFVGSKFYIFGGQKDDGEFLNDIWSFDLQDLVKDKDLTREWTRLVYPEGMPVPPRRTGHTSVTHNDTIYVFGGTDGQFHYNDTWAYNTTTHRWSELKCIGYIPAPREGHAATLVDDVMYIFGGRGVDGKDLEDLAAFKIGNARWFMFQNMGPAPTGRSGHAMATWQNKVFVLGGESYTGAVNPNKRPDDINMVHVLDTGKIKYPPDNRQNNQAVARKSSIPQMAPSASQSQQPFQVPTNGALSGTEEDPARRAASPTNPINVPRNRMTTGGTGIPLPSPQGQQSFAQLMGGGPGGHPGQPQQQQNGAPPGAGTDAASRLAKRATTGPLTGGGGGVGAGAGPGPGGNGIPPPRPRREDDPPLRTEPTRAVSPTGGAGAPQRANQSAVPPDALRSLRGKSMGPGNNSPGASPPAPYTQNFGGVPSPNISAARAGNVRSPSPQVGRRDGSASSADDHATDPSNHGGQPPSDAFYYGVRNTQLNGAPPSVNGRAPSPNVAAGSDSGHGSGYVVSESVTRELKTKEEEITAMKRRETWMRAALAMAAKKGFIVPKIGSADLHGTDSPPPSEEDAELVENMKLGSEAGDNRKFFEALMVVKQELGKAKAGAAEQARIFEDRVAEVQKSRAIAIQEAAFYRAKLSALENGSASDVSRLDRERISELERKLAEALSYRTELDSHANRLEADLEHEKEMRAAAEERATNASHRADAAETSYSRSLSDYADLQRRSHSTESTAHEHMERATTATSSAQQAKAQIIELRSQLDASENSLEQYLRTLEQTQVTLTASNVQADKMESLWKEAKAELAEQQTLVVKLQADLEGKTAELSQANRRLEDAERVVHSTREEYHAMRALTTGSLAELLATSREGKNRDVPSDDLQSQRLRAIEEEAESLRTLLSESRTRAESALSELAESRSRQIQLDKQVFALRSEVSAIRSHHSNAQDELRKTQAQITSREMELREKSRTAEAAEAKAGLLKSLMLENGLSINDEDSLHRSNSSGGDGNEVMARRLADLEAKMEERIRSYREMESAREAAEQRYQDAERQRQAADDQLADLQDEVEQLRAGEGSRQKADSSDGSVEAETQLRALQEKHRQLEGTHMKAVQFVKGTDKMLRRMKEELTRYKERNEQLEAEVAAKSADSSAAGRDAGLAELNSLRSQVSELRTFSEKTSTSNDDLQNRIRALQADYDRDVRQQQTDAAKRTEDLDNEVRRLEAALHKANDELEETLTINNKLNEELHSRLNSSSRSKDGGKDAARLETELTAAQRKADQLQRDNEELAARCKEHENKITILLDYMETQGHGGPSAANSSMDHSSIDPDGMKFDALSAELDRWQPSQQRRRGSIGSEVAINGGYGAPR